MSYKPIILEWSVCDTSFPAACEAQTKERSRECACDSFQAVQSTRCPAIPKPKPTIRRVT